MLADFLGDGLRQTSAAIPGIDLESVLVVLSASAGQQLVQQLVQHIVISRSFDKPCARAKEVISHGKCLVPIHPQAAASPCMSPPSSSMETSRASIKPGDL